MVTVLFNDHEQEVLTDCLQRELTNLHDEIVHTDDHDYREFLKQRQQVLKTIVAKLATEQLAVQP